MLIDSLSLISVPTTTDAAQDILQQSAPAGDTNLISMSGNFNLEPSGALAVNFTVGGTSLQHAVAHVANAAAGQVRSYRLQSGGEDRWALRASSSAESGANAGSNLALDAFDDTGTLLWSPITVSRATGLVSMVKGAVISGGSSTIDGANIGANSAGTVKCTAFTVGLDISAITTTTYTVAAADCALILAPTAGMTLTLPTPTGLQGRILKLVLHTSFAVISAGSNVVPLAGGAAGTAIMSGTAGQWCELISNGSSWYIFASN